MSESKAIMPAKKGSNHWAYIAGIICSACVFLGSSFTLWQSVFAILFMQGIVPSHGLILFRNVDVMHLVTTARNALILSVIAAVLSLGMLVFLLVRLIIKRHKQKIEKNSG